MLLGTFSDLLAFGYVKIVKIEFFIQGAQFSIKPAFLADFIENWAPFIKKLNFDNLYRPKSQKVRKCSQQPNTRSNKKLVQCCNFCTI